MVVQRVEIDIRAESRPLRNMNKPVRVHDNRVPYTKTKRFLRDENLKVLAIANRAAHVEICDVEQCVGGCMDLAVDSKGFA